MDHPVRRRADSPTGYVPEGWSGAVMPLPSQWRLCEGGEEQGKLVMRAPWLPRSMVVVSAAGISLLAAVVYGLWMYDPGFGALSIAPLSLAGFGILAPGWLGQAGAVQESPRLTIDPAARVVHIAGEAEAVPLSAVRSVERVRFSTRRETVGKGTTTYLQDLVVSFEDERGGRRHVRLVRNGVGTRGLGRRPAAVMGCEFLEYAM